MLLKKWGSFTGRSLGGEGSRAKLHVRVTEPLALANLRNIELLPDCSAPSSSYSGRLLDILRRRNTPRSSARLRTLLEDCIMTLRSLAALCGIVLVVCLAAFGVAQDTPPTSPKSK